MNFHRGEISTVKKINLKKAYKILQTHFFDCWSMCFGFLLWVFKVHVSLCFNNFWYGIGDFFRNL